MRSPSFKAETYLVILDFCAYLKALFDQVFVRRSALDIVLNAEGLHFCCFLSFSQQEQWSSVNQSKELFR